ncbi:alkaline serine protease [Phialemonium atrogriseum]|uniref:tripeptidyl-peptidase II n=1 Tax=Phialemonium atrogriseum TaxID=1093897 RepID=A0AAJ0C0W1_9PEZI|nr:alkaline serine protease [Phialemonium atrogriseum]KAK1766642.1 alkaline serine protease [Phialemonium atrogriseum]
MLFRHLTIALATGLAIEAAATPLYGENGDTLEGRGVPSSHALHERQLPHWATTWQKRDRVPSSAVLPVRIGLKQSNLDQGRNMLLDISTPKSANYGKHMSAEEVIDFFAPPGSSVDTVTEWLTEAGIGAERISQSINKQWIQFEATAAEVEDILFTEYHVFEHRDTGTKNIACDEYHIPSHVREHVDYITPGIRLRVDKGKSAKLRRKREAEALQKRGVAAMNTGLVPIPQAKLPNLPQLNSSVCHQYVTNECIRKHYRVPKGTTAAKGNELGIFESLNDHYSKDDLDVFWANLFPEIPQGTYPIDKLIDGAIGAAETPEEVGAESALDFQVAWPLIWPQNTVLFQTDDQYIEVNQTDPDTPYLGFWNTFFDALDGSYCTYSAHGETGNCEKAECLDPQYPDPNPGGYQGELQCGVYEPTNVISISYGGGEGDLPGYYLRRQCDEIMKLGLQGVTVVISSGDDGVGSYPGDAGLQNGCAGPNGTVFYPGSDATCPFVLAVGSTQLDGPPGTGNFSRTSACRLTEVATTRFPSGGGFSNVFDTPAYQRRAVETYLADTAPGLAFEGYSGDPGTNFSDVGDGVYRIGGRGYPDVAAVGDRFVVRAGGSWGTIGGTSLSAPVWAAFLTLVNEERIAAGKGTVGFINPVLYENPEVFHDITNGSNPNCNSGGFVAAKGWDPVSGLGSPNYPKLLKLLLSLP